ncbi:MAG: hypothetical protein GWP08_13835 [Nitrospiraceae bacterium]|nr:hypothetical protein [Nitrospiraceae bacterium]
MSKLVVAVNIIAVSMALGAPGAFAKDIRILYLTKSQGFEHSVVSRKGDAPSFSGRILAKLAKDNGMLFEETKDASAINAQNLKNYDIVVFFTQGDPTQRGKDRAPVMDAKGVDHLLKWIKKGGRFAAFHSGSDTFHSPPRGEATPYIQMVGGEFRGHGAQFVGALKVVDAEHPAMKRLPPVWNAKEEWYLFRNVNTESIHVLALMDPGGEGANQKDYDLAPYPMVWCSAYGKGKVYFNGMGHREDVWESDNFQNCIVDAFNWLLEEKTPAEQTAPNYDEVVPKAAAAQ